MMQSIFAKIYTMLSGQRWCGVGVGLPITQLHSMTEPTLPQSPSCRSKPHETYQQEPGSEFQPQAYLLDPCLPNSYFLVRILRKQTENQGSRRGAQAVVQQNTWDFAIEYRGDGSGYGSSVVPSAFSTSSSLHSKRPPVRTKVNVMPHPRWIMHCHVSWSFGGKIVILCKKNISFNPF